MSENTTIKLCILWEGELREAARLLHQAHAEGLDDDTRSEAMNQAFLAAVTALWGLTDDHACVLVGSDEIRKKRATIAKKRSADPTSGQQEKP